MAERHSCGREDGKNVSSSNAAIVMMAWEHGDSLSIPPADHRFDLVINKVALDCVMCSSDQIERRINMYRDKVGMVLRLGDL